MPEVQEVFRMATQKIRPDHGFVDRQQDRRQRRQRNRKLGAFAVAAAIGVAAVALILGTRGGPTTTPAITPATTATNQPSTAVPVDAKAQRVATNFVEAFGAFDADRAISYVANGADLSGVGGSPERLRLLISWLEATGYKQILDPCEANTFDSDTFVSCGFDFHSLGSDEIGLGPFGGSTFDLTVRDGEVVRASLNFETATFSPKMWEPFALWVSTTYPDDAVVMYENATYSEQQLSAKSIQLWRQHTREYVNQVGNAQSP